MTLNKLFIIINKYLFLKKQKKDLKKLVNLLTIFKIIILKPMVLQQVLLIFVIYLLIPLNQLNFQETLFYLMMQELVNLYHMKLYLEQCLLEQTLLLKVILDLQ